MTAPRAQDVFELTVRGQGGVELQHVWRIRCCKCGGTFDVVNGSGSRLPMAMLAKRFSAAGWKVHKRADHHVCPDCKARPAPEPAAPSNVVRLPALAREVPMPPTAEPPRQPTREDRQRVHAEIDRHWSTSGDGYAGNLSDARIAAALDVPRAWVAEIRDQFFGPDTNEARAAGLTALADLEARARALEEQGLQMATDAEALLREIAAVKKAAQG